MVYIYKSGDLDKSIFLNQTIKTSLSWKTLIMTV